MVGRLLVGACLITGCEPSRYDWDIRLADTGSELQQDPKLGVDLELHLALRYQTERDNLSSTHPEGVVVVGDDETAADVRVLQQDPVEVIVIPRRPGPNRLRFLADNNDDVGEVSYEALAVSSVSFETFVEGGPHSRASAIHMFTTSSLQLLVSYASGDGRAVLGKSPITLAPAGATTLAGTTITAGPAPADVTLTTALLGATLAIGVVDSSAIADIAIANQAQLIDIPQGDNVYLTADPIHGDGLEITGRPRPPRTIAITGDAAVQIAAPDPEVIGVNAFTPGSADLAITWGAVTKTVPISVVPR